MAFSSTGEYLFGKWRSEIKSEIAAQWAARLRSPGGAYGQWVDGGLSASFLGTPHAAARILAESMFSAKNAAGRASWATPTRTRVWPNAAGRAVCAMPMNSRGK